MCEYVEFSLDGFCFTFLHCNSLSKGTADYFLEEAKFVWIFRMYLTKFGMYSVCFFFRLNIFAGKISNLLLPLAAERAGDCES